jgi:hypothetical protein
MYLPLGPFNNSCFAIVNDFVVSTANSVINPAIIFSSQKSTMHVNLLLTLSNYTIFSIVHSIGLIQLVG